MTPDIRKSIIAGSWYPGRPDSLRSQIQGFLREVPESTAPPGSIGGLDFPPCRLSVLRRGGGPRLQTPDYTIPLSR